MEWLWGACNWVPVFVTWALVVSIALIRVYGSLRAVRRSWEASLHAGEEAKRQIRFLTVARYGLIGVQILLLAFMLWSSWADFLPGRWRTILAVAFLPLNIAFFVVNRRWRDMIAKGIDYES